MEITDEFCNEGPFCYRNWKAMTAGLPSRNATEYCLYSDIIMFADPDQNHGPYKLMSLFMSHKITGLRPVIALQVEHHNPNENRSHADEIAAIVSLCLGIRLEAGPLTRAFNSNDDVRGHPVGWEYHKTPVLPPTQDHLLRAVIPAACGYHSMRDAEVLSTLTKLSPSTATALFRAAKLYQNALWLAETQPELTWLMLVSAVEVAAGQWRSSKESALERMLDFKPDLADLLRPHGEELMSHVAVKIADFMGSTRKFRDFLLTFLPEPPIERTEEAHQHPWTTEALKKTFNIIYGHRSKALHDGIPFPAPMCVPPLWNGGFSEHRGIYREKPEALISQDWKIEDTPMYLYLFEYIVRNALLKWWHEMSRDENDPKGLVGA